jgi:hypothetical protein
MGNFFYDQGLKAGLDLSDAMDHIDRIYSARILGIYGISLALGVATQEFDQIMSLTPKPPAPDNSIVDIFVAVLEHIPIAGEAYEGAKIAAEVAHYTAKAIKGAQTAAQKIDEATKHFREDGKQLDSLEPDEDAMKIIRSRSTKLPLFQKVLGLRYQAEYDRRADRQRFRDQLRAALDKHSLTGTPLDLAKKLFGPAPGDLKPQDVYKEFETLQTKLLRELIKVYVRKYVSVFWWVEHPAPPNPVYSLWGIEQGLNQPQWDYIYSRFGKKADKRAKAARLVHTALVTVSPFAKVMGIEIGPFEVKEPILSDVEDLWRFWGAKLYKTEHWWYGKSEPFVKELPNPVVR